MEKTELQKLALDILTKMHDLEQATLNMTLALGDEEVDWWEECLDKIDEGLTNGKNILCKNTAITWEQQMLMDILDGGER